MPASFSHRRFRTPVWNVNASTALNGEMQRDRRNRLFYRLHLTFTIMENNPINMGEAIPCITDSDDSEKAFLLHLASKLCPTATEEKSEKKRLKILHLRLSRLAKLFSTLHNYPWGMNEAEIRKACVQYFMDSNEPRAKRNQLNEMLYQQAILVNKLSGFKDLIDNVLTYYVTEVEKSEKIIDNKA